MAALSPLERRVATAIGERRDELLTLACELVALDTTTHAMGEPARKERELQGLIAERLRVHGADVTVTEPDAALVAGHRYVPDGFDFAGRPQLAGRFPGAGGGRTLLLCGHVDVVSVEPRERWSTDPFDPVVRDGRLYGRGACDMKGGVASMIVAACALAELGIPLAGDLIVNTVTEEESSGAGGLVSARTLQADAAIVPEPTTLEVWIACRGSLIPTITVEGRAGHAGIPPGDPAKGGAVNAIEKMALVLAALGELQTAWAQQPAHPYLSPPVIVPTVIAGGEWVVSFPSSCRLDCHVEFLPGQGDGGGWGEPVEREIEDWVAAAARADPWLAEHPPRIGWLIGGVPAAAVSADAPVVRTLCESLEALGRPVILGGLDNWHDGATLTVEAGMPAICFGPGDIHRAHSHDEFVPVADLVACAQGIAVAAMRFCGLDR